MSTVDQADAPIYDRLIAERGDVPADVRRTAEEARQEAADALDWQGLGVTEE